MNLQKQINQLKIDIEKNGPHYPALVVYKNNQFIDYALSTEVKVMSEETSKEMTLEELLKELQLKSNG